jgi:uncharacterized protein YbjT (DUF2867 family)
MRVVIAGGHGQIALRLERLLAARGDDAVALIRNPDHRQDVEQAGGRPVVCDLEQVKADQVAEHLRGADAAVFAAGAGPGSGVTRKFTVDRDASVLLADAAEQAGVARFLQISSMGAGKPPAPGGDEVWAAYLQAKTEAEDDLRARDLGWTILRPGGLTDEHGTWRVTLAEPPLPRGSVTRDDVAAVIVALLDTPGTDHLTLELTNGEVPVTAAVRAVARGAGPS